MILSQAVAAWGEGKEIIPERGRDGEGWGGMGEGWERDKKEGMGKE